MYAESLLTQNSGRAAFRLSWSCPIPVLSWSCLRGRFVLAGAVASGEDALAFLADHDVALVLVDLHLGGADGVTTARLYGEAGGQGVVVLMSTTAVPRSLAKRCRASAGCRSSSE